ncbi:hypothetical protein Plec18167_006941 [Paecilomyces lecythidis]|uniref:BZIP domain-containing protein n=1 Tax=Paecilomyces lecythidis TaxID=3004212 RepID=A0ABR3X775_9EURO
MAIPQSASREDSRTTPEPSLSPASPPPPPPASPKLEHPNDPSATLPQAAQARKVRHNRRLARPPEPDRLHAGWLPRGIRDEVRVNRRATLQKRADRRKRVKEALEKQAQEAQEQELRKEIQRARQKDLEEWIAQNDWEEKYAREEKGGSEMGEDEMQLHAELQMHVEEWEGHEVQLHSELRLYVAQVA